MKINSKEVTIPSVEECIEILTDHNRRSGIYFDYERLIQDIVTLQMSIASKKALLMMRVVGSASVRLKDDFIYELKKRNFEKYFLSTDKKQMTDKGSNGKISLGAESVTFALNSELPDEWKQYVKVYAEFVSESRILSSLTPFENVPLCDEVSFESRPMIRLESPLWVAQNTGRIGTQGNNINGFPSEYMHLLTVPKGYLLASCDSSQMEPREIYSFKIPDPQIKALINLYGDAYYGVLHYCKLSAMEIASGSVEFEKMDTESIKAQRASIKTYNNAVAYGSTSNDDFDPIKDLLIEKINNHPLRIKWLNEVEQIVNSGKTVCYTYFGTPIDVLANVEKPEERMATTKHQLIKKFLNNPIQGTAADLMRYAIVYANDYLALNSPMSTIIKSQYDSLSFQVYEDDFDKVKDHIENAVAYEVDDWIPIPCECNWGRQESMIKDLVL